MNVASVGEQLALVQERIAAVERSWTHPIDVVAVTKGFGPEAIEVAVGAGCGSIGENYAQELAGKRDVIERLRPQVHFIGHLQSNKVRLIAPLVAVWETVDRASIATEIARRAAGARVLIQVNATGEESKSGCPPQDVAALVGHADAGRPRRRGVDDDRPDRRRHRPDDTGIRADPDTRRRTRPRRVFDGDERRLRARRVVRFHPTPPRQHPVRPPPARLTRPVPGHPPTDPEPVCGRHDDRLTSHCLPQTVGSEFAADIPTVYVEVSATNPTWRGDPLANQSSSRAPAVVATTSAGDAVTWS